MKTRIITSILALFIFIPLILTTGITNGYSLVLMCQAMSVIASIEILKVTGFLKSFYISVPALAISFVFPLIGKLYPDRFIYFSGLVFFIFGFYLLSFSVFKHKHKVDDYAILFIMLFYIIVSSSCIVILYGLEFGEYLYLLCFLCAWVSDSAAYFTGRAFGKHKLCPEISPKKTVEGAIGGFVFCVAFVIGYALIIGELFDVKTRMLYIIIASAFMSLVSMLGDLIASQVKRRYGIKDYGRLFPGHGGVVDRFDSVFAIAPTLYILYSSIEGFSFFV